MQGTGIEPAKGLTRWVLSPVPLTARPPLLIKKSKKKYTIYYYILFRFKCYEFGFLLFCSNSYSFNL